MPKLVSLHEKYKDKGLVLIGVHSDPNAEKMKEVVAEAKLPYPIALDKGGKETFKAFGADSYPDYYLIDRKGNVRFADLANKEVDRAVEMLIAEK